MSIYIYLKISRVSRNENLFIFFQNDNKNAGSSQKSRVIGVSGNTALFFQPEEEEDLFQY